LAALAVLLLTAAVAAAVGVAVRTLVSALAALAPAALLAALELAALVPLVPAALAAALLAVLLIRLAGALSALVVLVFTARTAAPVALSALATLLLTALILLSAVLTALVPAALLAAALLAALVLVVPAVAAATALALLSTLAALVLLPALVLPALVLTLAAAVRALVSPAALAALAVLLLPAVLPAAELPALVLALPPAIAALGHATLLPSALLPWHRQPPLIPRTHEQIWTHKGAVSYFREKCVVGRHGVNPPNSDVLPTLYCDERGLFDAVTGELRDQGKYPRNFSGRRGIDSMMMTVARIWRYPVKSLAGEELRRARIGPLGVEGDRILHVEDEHGRALTSRTNPELLAHKGSLDSRGTPLVDGRPWDEAQVEGRLVRSGEPRFDVLPLLVATDGAIAAFGHDYRRLRPNLVIGGVEGMAETGWEGGMLRIGAVRIGVRDLRLRCIMTSFDPDTQVQDKSITRGIYRRFGGKLALNCFVIEGGEIAVGDPVIFSVTRGGRSDQYK
jgi:hypothetical protein